LDIWEGANVFFSANERFRLIEQSLPVPTMRVRESATGIAFSGAVLLFFLALLLMRMLALVQDPR